MKTTIKIRHACGCEKEHEIQWDGRLKFVEVFLEDPNRPGYISSQSVLMAPRQAAENQCRRAYPANRPCLQCHIAACRAELAKYVPAPIAADWSLPLEFARACARIAARTGGKISRSPKSRSMYVTWSTGAWRISDHPWPGRMESLVHEHAAGRRVFVARLTQDWLNGERVCA